MPMELKVNLGSPEVYDWATMEAATARHLEGQTFEEIMETIVSDIKASLRQELSTNESELRIRLDNARLMHHNASIAIFQELLEKVDKVAGKGLSTNDFTNEDKDKLRRFIETKQEVESFISMILGR